VDTHTEIKVHLVREKIKQKQLSELTGISQPRISAALNGKTRFTLDEYGLIIVALNVPADRFLKPMSLQALGREATT